jgi:membrane protease YdiL (CAAX protease family)
MNTKKKTMRSSDAAQVPVKLAENGGRFPDSTRGAILVRHSFLMNSPISESPGPPEAGRGRRRPVLALWLTLAGVWAAVFIGGAAYLLRPQNTPLSRGIWAAVLLAAAIEVSLYVASGFQVARDLVRRLRLKSLWIAASTLPAYLIYTLGTGTFSWKAFLGLVVLAAVISWWYEVLPAGLWTDFGFLAMIASGLLFGLFAFLYPPLSKSLKTDYIGHVMWLRLSYWVLLTVRDRGDFGFGFIPRREEWAIGARYFTYCVPAAGVVLWAVQPMRLKDHLTWGATPLVVVGTFAGLLWVVALSEELFFRGMLQPAISESFQGAWRGLVATSAMFGLVHLSFGKFPNWRMVLLAGVLGLFCGRAAQVAGSIRASMVTHALVVTLYRVFLVNR